MHHGQCQTDRPHPAGAPGHHGYLIAAVLPAGVTVRLWHRSAEKLRKQKSDAERQRSEKLMGVMDELNQKMGRGTVKIGTPSAGAAWHLRCAHRSPRYTKRWREIPRARA